MIPSFKKLLCGVLPLYAFCLCAPGRSVAQASDPVAQALEEGKLYESKHKWDMAYDAYHKADKLSHHTSADALIHIALIEKKVGLLSEAANDAKKAVATAGDNKALALQARLLRATLLSALSNKPSDNKLKDAEAELRLALTLDPQLPITHFNLGMVLLKQEKDAEGVAELKNYVALPNTDPQTAAEAKRLINNPVRARTPFVPNFSVTTLENESFSNASLRGKVVLIDFWGTWCPPCRESIPILRNIQRRYSGKAFQLLSISSDDDEEILKTFIRAQRMDWAEYLDSSGELQERFKVDSFPTYLVVDKDGVVRFRQSGLGPETQSDLEEAINKALKKESNPELAKIAAQGDTSMPEGTQSGNVTAPRATSGQTSASSAPTGDTSRSSSSSSTVADATAGNVFKYSRLGLRYTFPEGWRAAPEDTLRATNDRVQEQLNAALQKQPAQEAGNIQLIAPSYIFYASRRGDGSPERASLPSLSIRMEPARMDTVDPEQFQQAMERMAAATQLKPLAPGSSFEVKKHKFVRADFERSSGALHYYVSYVQTVVGDYLLRIDIVAESPEQLDTIAGTLQSTEIDESE